MLISKIKKFLEDLRSKKEPQKLLMAPSDDVTDFKINLTPIKSFMEQDKYAKNLHLLLIAIKPSERKKLIKSINEQIEKGNVPSYDAILVEGLMSGKSFISVRQNNITPKKWGQIILTENSYIVMSTRRITKDDNLFSELYYKERSVDGSFEVENEYSEDAESYSIDVRNGDTVFFEHASYANRENSEEVETLAQPSNDPTELKEYAKLTSLPFVSTDNMHSLATALKTNPYIVKVEASKRNKNNEVVSKKSLTKVFKSKKECIVGYRPEVLLLDGFSDMLDNSSSSTQMFRLLPSGVYVDNNSFKKNFEGKYSINKVSLDDIEKIVNDEIPFGLSNEAKSSLRNGIQIPDHVKRIYIEGIQRIKALGLDRIENEM